MPAHLVSRRRPVSGFTLIELVVAFFIVAIVVALLLPATRRTREPARRTQCKSNLKQIGLALHNYYDTWGAFPPAYSVDAEGKPLHSWRTLLLPYLDQKPLYDKLDLTKPWDDPANATAFESPVAVYLCPSNGSSPRGHTTYLAVVTENSCLLSTRPRPLSEITDGTSNTLIIIEVPHNHAVPWMAPRDADATVLQNFGPKSKQLHVGGAHTLLADGSVRFLSENIPANTYQALITATGGETVGEF